MNYVRIYQELISYAQQQKLNEYSEIHHIKPASMCKVSKRYGTLHHYVWDIDADTQDNLVALTARQHYIAHLLLAKIYPEMTQCLAIFKTRYANSNAYSLGMLMLSKFRQEQYKNGTHNLCGLNEQRVLEGTHNFLKQENGSSIASAVQNKRVENGTHHFLGEQGSKLAKERNAAMIKKGTHVSVNTTAMNKLKKTRAARVDAGTWHTCGVRPWNNNSTKEYPRYLYSCANEMFCIWYNNKTVGSRKISTLLNMKWSQTHDNIIKMFRDGWVPSLDAEWVLFKQSFSGAQ